MCVFLSVRCQPHIPFRSHFPPLSPQVKIWFQNKRSKFKKLMKQGSGTIDANALASGRGLSSGSPTVAPVWSSPTTVKTSVGTSGSYIPSYTSWYPSTHQESMQQSQLMWAETRTESAMARVLGLLNGGAPSAPLARFSRGRSADHTQPEPNPEFLLPPANTVASEPDDGKQGDRETRDARNAPEDINKSMTVCGSPSTNGPVCLAALYHLCVSFYFFFPLKRYVAALFCLWEDACLFTPDVGPDVVVTYKSVCIH